MKWLFQRPHRCLSCAAYNKLFMDQDNIALAAAFSDKSDLEKFSKLQNYSGTTFRCYLDRFILFQKFQRVAHGQITFDEYFEDFQRFSENYKGTIPVYSNDAEIFDFRPGRFKERLNSIQMANGKSRKINFKLKENLLQIYSPQKIDNVSGDPYI